MKATSRNAWIFYVFLICAGLAGAGLVIASISHYGPGLTHDSTAYIFAAKSLLQGEGFQYFGYPSPFIQWPPLYPLLLAAAGFFGIGSLTASGAINSAAFGMIIAFAGFWLYTRSRYKPAAVWGVLILVFSLPLIQVSQYLWTEALFILFYILFYVSFENYIKKQSFGYLASAGFFTALALMDRYAGVTIVLAAAVFLIFQRKSFSKRISDIFAYGVISCLPFALWIARNYLVSSTLLGVRIPSTYGLALNIKRSVDSVLTWIRPDAILRSILPGTALKSFMVFSVLLPVVIFLAFAVSHISGLSKKSLARDGGSSAGQWDSRYFSIRFQAVFAAIYTVYLLASATKVLFEPINSRYLSPLYIPFIIFLLPAADIIAERMRTKLASPLWKCAVAIVAGLFLVYPALNTAAAVINSSENGAGGYSTKAWQENKLIAYMLQNPNNGTYYSNNADIAAALTGIRTFYPPKKEGPYMYGPEQFKKAVEEDESSVLVWFKGGTAASLYDITDIGKLYTLEKIEENESGEVYRIVR